MHTFATQTHPEELVEYQRENCLCDELQENDFFNSEILHEWDGENDGFLGDVEADYDTLGSAGWGNTNTTEPIQKDFNHLCFGMVVNSQLPSC